LITDNETGGNLEPAYYYDDGDILQTVPDAILTTLSECDAPFDWWDRLRFSRVVIGDGNECCLLHDENHCIEAFTMYHDGIDWQMQARDSIIIPVMDEITGLQIPNKLMAIGLQPTARPAYMNGFRLLPLSWPLEAEVELLQLTPGEISGGS
jgi:hypothetical protein